MFSHVFTTFYTLQQLPWLLSGNVCDLDVAVTVYSTVLNIKLTNASCRSFREFAFLAIKCGTSFSFEKCNHAWDYFGRRWSCAINFLFAVLQEVAGYRIDITRIYTITQMCSTLLLSKQSFFFFFSFNYFVLLNSEELLTALGIDENTLPPLVYRMRQLGYPPGWLKEAEMENSGLSLYDGNGTFLTRIKNSLHLFSFSKRTSRKMNVSELHRD